MKTFKNPDSCLINMYKGKNNFEINIQSLTSCYYSTEYILNAMLLPNNQKTLIHESSLTLSINNDGIEDNNNVVDLKSLPLEKVITYLRHRGSSYILSTDQIIKTVTYFDLTSQRERLMKKNNALQFSADTIISSNNTDKPEQSNLSSACQIKMEDDVVKIIRLLEEKEKDLELAARIGKSLLEQNQELKERNFFLHDSLAKNADTINELRHQVKYKEKLIRSIKKDDDMEMIEEEKNTNTSVNCLKEKVAGLKKENDILKNETKELRILNNSFEEEKRTLVEQYTRHLDKANAQISKLQKTICDKNQECLNQTKEIEKLMKEISEQKNQEKAVVEENALLTEQLGEMIINHEQLKNEIFELQDKYTEVFDMLKEAEEELCRFRKKSSMFGRTMSSDSLYDSLASEIEVHDSGFYTTPMVSARSDSRCSNGILFHKDDENVKLKYLPIEENLSNELAAIGYNKCFLNENSNNIGLLKEAADEKISTFSGLNYKEITEHPIDPTSNATTPLVEKIPHPTLSSTPIKGFREIENKIQTRDISCSPIKELLNNNYSDCDEITPRVKRRLSQYDSDSDSDMILVRPKHNIIQHSQSIDLTNTLHKERYRNLSKTDSSSNDSLAEYTPMQPGVPGKLGTRDLEYCIKKVALRKKVEKEYEKYRASNGLGPSKFPLFLIGFKNKNDDSLPYTIGSLTEQFNALSKGNTLKNNKICEISLIGKPYRAPSLLPSINNIQKSLQETSNITDNNVGMNILANDNKNNRNLMTGIVSRNNMPTSPSKSLNNTPTKNSFTRKIFKSINMSSFSPLVKPMFKTDFPLPQTYFSRESSPTSMSSYMNGLIQGSSYDFLSAPESPQKLNGIINRIDIFTDNKHNQK
uniref:HAP1 N-terminal domain-containing protein n=1 Tax=Parastrongyloides trichosuri TaxID=131310 RepID=A0A0N4ZUX7_PARTI